MTNGAHSGGSPVWVWVISAFYVLSASLTLLSFALMFRGAIKLHSAEAAYFASLTTVDYFFTLCIGVIALAGAISLFLLRRHAVVLFSLSLILNVALTAVHVVRTNFAEAFLTGSGVFGLLLGWLILVAVNLYARGLAKRGVLC
jgi:hypothetical protein